MDYPGDWEIKKLGECVSEKLSYGLNAPAIPYDRKNPAYLRITDITDDGKYNDNDRKSVVTSERERYTLHYGDIVLARTGSTGKSYLYDPKDGELVYAGYLIKVSVNCREYDPRYIAAQLRTPRYWKWVASVSKRSVQSGINAQEYSSFLIPLPPLNEQQAIADTLTVFDTHITNLANLIAKKKAIRDGALEDLMSARTRLKGFSGEWEVVLLGSKCEITSSKRVFESEWKTSGIPFLRTRDIANFHAGIEGKDKLFISEDTYKEKISVSGEVKEGDLLVTGVGTIGLPFIIETNERLYFKDGNILWLKRSKDINTKFLYYLFLSKDIQQQINDACGFTTVGTLTIQNAKKLQINLPPLPEQQAIADTLTAFDDEINALESERGKIIQIRDGAMNDLLTGKVRLLHHDN